jgi:hypothetical protein
MEDVPYVAKLYLIYITFSSVIFRDGKYTYYKMLHRHSDFGGFFGMN